MCSHPAALQNAALFPYTPASRRSVSNAGEKTVYHLSFWNAPLPRWRPQVRVSSTAPAGVRRLAADVFCCARAPPRFKTPRFAPILPPAVAMFPMPVGKLHTISVSGMPPCQGGGRESESRLPLQPMSVALRRTFFVVLVPRCASKRCALPLYSRQPLPCFQYRRENCIPSKIFIVEQVVYCTGEAALCIFPRDSLSRNRFAHTGTGPAMAPPLYRTLLLVKNLFTPWIRLSAPRRALAALYFQYLQPPSGRYSPHKSLHAIHTATPLAKAQITLHRPRLVERPFTLPAPATAYQALAALYSRCPRLPSGRYSPHKSLHAIHTAIPLAKAQITLHLPSLLKHPSAPLSPASGNRPSGPRRSVFPLPTTSVWPVFSA